MMKKKFVMAIGATEEFVTTVYLSEHIIREKAFLTQTELAEILGVSFTTVNRWENGKYKPTMKIKKKLHELFLKHKIQSEDKE